MRPLFTIPLPESLLTALNKSGFYYLEDLSEGESNVCQKEALEILELHGVSWDDIKSSDAAGSVSASQLLRKEQMNEYIPTFSEALDKTLGGGVQTDSLLQICGPPASGKTQLGLQLCVSVQIPVSLGGLGAESVFIDTEGTFSPTRIREISSAASDHCQSIAKMHNIVADVEMFTTDFILSRIHYTEARNLVQLISSVRRLKELLKGNLNIKLIVIDSMTFPFLKVTNTLERTRYISTIIGDLRELASEYNMAIVITNHLTTKVSEEGKSLAPALGESFTHLIPATLILGAVNNFFSAVVHKSSKLKEEIVTFKVTKEGIRDV